MRNLKPIHILMRTHGVTTRQMFDELPHYSQISVERLIDAPYPKLDNYQVIKLALLFDMLPNDLMFLCVQRDRSRLKNRLFDWWANFVLRRMDKMS